MNIKNKKIFKYPILILVIFCLFFSSIQISSASNDWVDLFNFYDNPENLIPFVSVSKVIGTITGKLMADDPYEFKITEPETSKTANGDVYEPISMTIDGKNIEGVCPKDFKRFYLGYKKNGEGILSDNCYKVGSDIYKQLEGKINTQASEEFKIEETDLTSLYGVIDPYKTKVEIPCNTELAGGECPVPDNPAGYIARLYQFGLMIAGLTALLFLIIGAVRYTLSAGNFASKDDAKDQMLQAILGLALLMGAYLILYTINPNLVNLTNPAMEKIDLDTLAPPTGIYIDDEQKKADEQTLKDMPGCIESMSGSYGFDDFITLDVKSDSGTVSKSITGSATRVCIECASGYILEAGKCTKGVSNLTCESGYSHPSGGACLP
jgi:hypothetical protein